MGLLYLPVKWLKYVVLAQVIPCGIILAVDLGVSSISNNILISLEYFYWRENVPRCESLCVFFYCGNKCVLGGHKILEKRHFVIFVSFTFLNFITGQTIHGLGQYSSCSLGVCYYQQQQSLMQSTLQLFREDSTITGHMN